jgi:DNA-binding CsgD family transcriptional regulator
MCTSHPIHGDSLTLDACTAGLTQYRRALEAGTLPASDAPDCLLRLGLLHPLSNDPGMLVPVSPDAAAAALIRPIDRLVLEQQWKAADVRTTLNCFDAVYSEARTQERFQLKVITGAADISAALDSAVRACSQDLLTVQPGGGRDPDLLGEALDRDLAVLSGGVRQRTIYQHSVRAHRPTLAYIEQVTAAGAEIRTIPEVVDRLIICDETVAYIPTGESRAIEALEIRHPALIRFLRGSFEQQWEAARTIETEASVLASPDVASDTEASIAALLVTGHTDESISRRLGMGRRTVALHVRKLSDRFASNSRAQLGYQIARSRFLSVDVPTPPGPGDPE